MTKVEELRGQLQEMLKGEEEEPHEHSDAWTFVAKLFTLLEDKWQGPLPDIITMHVYAVQSSAREEGVAEGAEQMRKEILSKSVAVIPKASVHVDDDGTVYVDPTAFIGVGAEASGAKVYLVGASVLAPTKEGE